MKFEAAQRGIDRTGTSPHGSCDKCGGGLLKLEIQSFKKYDGKICLKNPEPWTAYIGCAVKLGTPEKICIDCGQAFGSFVGNALVDRHNIKPVQLDFDQLLAQPAE
jgi:hypothetical protein